ncbi:Trk family potassium uptake protein [Paenibacillus anaericanus]|uniref:Trk family potassium uptake protein n=1 Tax=Paenibacillus anaericanus TaxID=170367 RepID=A0A433YDS7_9BACL|nr:TrkH family potassium uptake protein [Paenibacillus anaericanus]RUT48022.1 Trk family potassium uptake protein [Paenibacillus anaericanus]
MPKPNKSWNPITPAKTITYGFAVIILIGTFLLSLSISSADGQKLDLIDAFFTATSATCVTGLAVVDTGTQFSLFGQIVVITLTQIGGLGFMAMGTLIALAFNRRISLRERLVLQEAMNHNSMEGLFSLIRRVMIYSLVIEAVGAVLLATRWSLDMPLSQAIYFGVFHSISIFNNGGFELFGMITGPFTGLTAYARDPFVNIVFMILIFLGGIGFIVMSDLLNFRSTRRLSLHSKIVLSMSFTLIMIGALAIFTMEITNPATLKSLSLGDSIFASFFHSISARSGGVSTVSVADMNQSTQFLLILLMFIGAAPGSTGGGIKVTVFAILLGAMYAMVRGKEDIVFFRKRISKQSILRAITQTWLALFLVIFVAMILSVFEDRGFLVLLFETTSAFATAGLSLDLTPKLTDISKILLSLVMFLGRVGPLTLAYAITSKASKEPYRYPEGKITIG